MIVNNHRRSVEKRIIHHSQLILRILLPTIQLTLLQIGLTCFPQGLQHQFPHPVVIGLLDEVQPTRICHQLLELRGEARSKHLYAHRQLLLEDLLVTVVVRVGLEVLPRQTPLQKVDKHVHDALQVVSPALLDPQMTVYRGIPRGTRQTLVVFVGNVLSSFADVLFGEAEVDHEHLRTELMGSDKKVLGFDVPVDELPRVDELQPSDDLHADRDCGAEGELLAAALEEVFEGGAQQVHDHDVVVVVLAEVEEPGDAQLKGVGVLVEIGQQLGLVLQLLVLGLEGLQLDSHRLPVLPVAGVVNLAEGAGRDLLGELVVLSDHQLHPIFEYYSRCTTPQHHDRSQTCQETTERCGQ